MWNKLFTKCGIFANEGETPSGAGDLNSFLATHIGDTPPVDGGADGSSPAPEGDPNPADGVTLPGHGVPEDTPDPYGSENEPSGDAPTPEDTPASGDDRIAKLEAQNAKLMEMLGNMQSMAQRPVVEDPPEPVGPVNPFESEGFSSLSDVMGWDSDEQAAMKTFLQSVTDFTQTSAVDAAQRSIPEIVDSAMSVQQKQKAVHESFYGDNPQLAVVKPFVAQISAAVVAEQKAQGIAIDAQNVLKETAKRAYASLGLQPGQGGGTSPKGGVAPSASSGEPGRGKPKPAFATQTGSRKAPAKMSDDEAMIQAMIDLDK